MAGFLAFAMGDGVRGLFIGYFLGMVVQLAIISWITMTVDWQEIVDNVDGVLFANCPTKDDWIPTRSASSHRTAFGRARYFDDKQSLLSLKTTKPKRNGTLS